MRKHFHLIFAALGFLILPTLAASLDVYGELRVALLEKLAADPTNTEARIYYNTASDTVKYRTGAAWKTVAENPMTTRGDMIRATTSGVPERFSAVTDNRVVRGDGTDVVLGQIDDPAFFTTGAAAGAAAIGIVTTTTQTFAGAKTFSSALTVDSDIIFSTSNEIRTNTSDAADNLGVNMAGGGSTSQTRGAVVEVYGNENAATGRLLLRAGNVSGGQVEAYTGGSLRARIEDDGDVHLLGNNLYIDTSASLKVLNAGSGSATTCHAICNATGTFNCIGVTRTGADDTDGVACSDTGGSGTNERVCLCFGQP